ncbi:MAG: T9SS type A sorting domain-containing protein, partial [Bacteroidales bacterium]|nr:T9SS type A sorting domain-containing protein [Bacteroidales bacterium]
TPPYLTGTIPDQEVKPGDVVFIKLSDYFADSTVNDALTFNVATVENTPLPEWATFDATDNKLTFNPSTEHMGEQVKLVITATDNFAEEAKDTVSVTVKTVSGIYTDKNDATIVYPIPAKETLFIETNDLIRSVCLLNDNGSLVLKENNLFGRTGELYVGHLPEGTYMLMVFFNNKTSIKKIIIIH